MTTRQIAMSKSVNIGHAAWYVEKGLGNSQVSVRPSVRPFVCPSFDRISGGFAAERSAGRRYRSTAADV